jgi:ATP-dependent Clp protease ATP-binding subunit ClpA
MGGISGVGGEVRSLYLQARDAARARKQPMSTGHLLLAMLQSAGEPADLLTQHGVREGALLSALKVVGEEPGTAMDIALERANKLALALGENVPTALHLLLTLACDPRTAAHRCLERTGAAKNKEARPALTVLRRAHRHCAHPRQAHQARSYPAIVASRAAARTSRPRDRRRASPRSPSPPQRRARRPQMNRVDRRRRARPVRRR